MKETVSKTVVLGASPNPTRASHLAVRKLAGRGDEVIAIGIRSGEIAGVLIQTERPEVENVETLTLYIGADNMVDWEEYALSLNPQRIIFNPGTENPQFEAKAKSAGIDTMHACTLVMLSTNTF